MVRDEDRELNMVKVMIYWKEIFFMNFKIVYNEYMLIKIKDYIDYLIFLC